MPDIDPKDPLQVPASHNQQPVQALGADRSHPSFGVGIRPGRPHRRTQHLDAFSAEDVVEAAAEFRVAVAQQQSDRPSPLAQSQQQVAGLLGDPPAVRVGGHAGQVDLPGVDLDHVTYRYSVVSRTVSTVKKSVAMMPAACVRRNARQVTDARRGAGPSPLRSSTVRMVVADTWTPSFLSSP